MMSYYTCRDRFSVDDVNFVVNVLATGEKERGKAFELFVSDQSCRDLMLDAANLYFAVTDLDNREFIQTSPYLYFYIIVRNLLIDLGVDDRTVADYVAEVLGSFIDSGLSATYVIDMISDEQAPPSAHEKAVVRLRNAENLLILTGLFHDFLEKRHNRHGAPNPHFYVEVGTETYRQLSKSDVFYGTELCHSFDVMGEKMPRIASCLHKIVR